MSTSSPPTLHSSTNIMQLQKPERGRELPRRNRTINTTRSPPTLPTWLRLWQRPRWLLQPDNGADAVVELPPQKRSRRAAPLPGPRRWPILSPPTGGRKLAAQLAAGCGSPVGSRRRRRGAEGGGAVGRRGAECGGGHGGGEVAAAMGGRGRGIWEVRSGDKVVVVVSAIFVEEDVQIYIRTCIRA